MLENSYNKMSLSKFESMLKTNSVFFFDSTEFESIIQHYLDVGRQTLAEKAINLGLEQHPTSVSLRLLKAESFIFMDKLDEADTILNYLHALEPNNEEIYIQKANLFSKRNEHERAIDALKTALVYTKEDADILAMIGMEYLFLDNFDDARLNFAKCLTVDFEDYSSLYNVVYCFDMQNQHAEAIEYLNDFIDQDPYSEVAWHQLGRQYFILEQYNEALRAFDYAVVIDEFFAGAYLEKAKTQEQLKLYEDAIENYLATTELDDPSSFAYYRIGRCYDRLDNKDSALKYYKKTVNEDPLLDKGWLALTNIYFEDKNYQKALFYINKAIAIDASNTLFWRRFAEINLKLNFFEEAIDAFKKCMEFNDKELDIFMGLSDVLNFVGEYKDASKILLKGLRLFPNHAEIEYRLGCVYFVLGDEFNGEKFLRKGFKTDYEYHTIFQEIFPTVFDSEIIKNLISEFKN